MLITILRKCEFKQILYVENPIYVWTEISMYTNINNPGEGRSTSSQNINITEQLAV